MQIINSISSHLQFKCKLNKFINYHLQNFMTFKFILQIKKQVISQPIFTNSKFITQSRMSRSKAWKQLNYVKNQQFKDTQSVISQSRSTSVYQFNKVKFSKSKIDDGQSSMKNSGLGSIVKRRQSSRQHSQLNISRRGSRDDSFAQILHRTNSKFKLKSATGRKFQIGTRTLMRHINKLHQQMKQMAQIVLLSFQKIKQQLQVNLIKIADQLLKMGKDFHEVQKIHQIISTSFYNVQRNFIILPPSLTQLGGHVNSQSLIKQIKFKQPPLTPKIDINRKLSAFKVTPQIGSLVNQNQIYQTSTKNIGKAIDFRQQSSKQKIDKNRPLTQRKRLQGITSFDHGSNRSPQTIDFAPGATPQSTQKIQTIILQMRQILNNKQ